VFQTTRLQRRLGINCVVKGALLGRRPVGQRNSIIRRTTGHSGAARIFTKSPAVGVQKYPLPPPRRFTTMARANCVNTFDI